MEALLIEVGLNEAVSQDEVPQVPVTPDEIAHDILECASAGASIVHFHARDPETGDQRFDAVSLYREVVVRVRDAGSAVLMYPTYPPFVSNPDQAVAERFGHVLELADDPDLDMKLGPLDMGSLNLVFGKDGVLAPNAHALPAEWSVYQNPLPVLWETARQYDQREMVTSLAIFEPGHLRLAIAFLRAGLCTKPIFKFFLSGAWLHGPLPDPDGLDFYVDMLRQLEGSSSLEWFCAPSGLESSSEIEALLQAAILRGGHVRVGVGDNPVAAAGSTNADLVSQAVGIARQCGRKPAEPAALARHFAAR
jgi:uncharacterized protein (DUF849 family)